MLARSCRSAGRAAAPRRWCTAAALKVPPDLGCSLRDVERRFMALRLQDALVSLERDHITKEEFFATSGGVGLPLDDAKKALEGYEAIGAVHMVDDMIHLRPVVLVNEVNEKLGLPKADPFPELTAEIVRLEEEFDELTADKNAADAEVAENRKRFWAMVAVLSACQMWGFTFLTFDSFSGELCWGWDDVEPMCWFITQGYVVMWFAWMFWRKREHSLEAFDEFRLHATSKAMYDRRGVDINRWLALKRQLREKKAEQQALSARWL